MLPNPSETFPEKALSPSLRVVDLAVTYVSDDRETPAVRGLSLEVGPGESLGVLGESGCGKSSLALAVVGLLPENVRIRGSVEVAGKPTPPPGRERAWRKIRGAHVGVVFQQPSLALNPFRKAGTHVVDVLRSHRPWSAERCRLRARELLHELGLPEEVFDAFPHQLSGGQQQRVVLAQALACEPRLLLADEPTTALDRHTEHRVLERVDRLRKERKTSMLWISHDPRVLDRVADRVLVMYAGRAMETGPADQVLNHPLHPYTRALLACRPRRKARAGEPLELRRLPTLAEPLDSLDGGVPDGCPFFDRCPHAAEPCREPFAPVQKGNRTAWCTRLEAVTAGFSPRKAPPSKTPSPDVSPGADRG